MMNIYELSRKSGLSLAKLRKLDALGALKVAKASPIVDEIRFRLSRNQPLTLAQIIALLDAPDILYDLDRYEARARAQMGALGDVRGGAAPPQVTAEIIGAGGRNQPSAAIIAAWLREVLTATPVPYHWVAARLLIGMAPVNRAPALQAMKMAMLIVRREIPEWWKKAEDGSTIYFRPAKISLDL